MAKANVWTVPYGDRWANRREGSERASRTFATRAEAIASGRRTAMRDGVDHVVAHHAGQAGERTSYRRDARP
jgi:hypothetical protein